MKDRLRLWIEGKCILAISSSVPMGSLSLAMNGLLKVWEVSTGSLFQAVAERIWKVSLARTTKLLTCGGDGAVTVYDLPVRCIQIGFPTRERLRKTDQRSWQW